MLAERESRNGLEGMSSRGDDLYYPAGAARAGAPFMLLSHHRSGSSFLNDLLRAHPRVESITEPLSQHLILFREADATPWRAEDFREERFHPLIQPGTETDAYIRELRRWLLASSGVIRGFKETAMFEKVPWLRALLGPVRTVVLTRDPRAVADSVVRRGLHESYWNYARRLEAYRHFRPRQHERFDRTDPVALAAAVWDQSMSAGLRYAREYGWLVLRLEDVLQESGVWLPRLMEYLGTAAHDDQWLFLREAGSETRGGTHSHQRAPRDVMQRWRESLDCAQQRTIERIAGDTMAQLRYS